MLLSTTVNSILSTLHSLGEVMSSNDLNDILPYDDVPVHSLARIQYTPPSSALTQLRSLYPTSHASSSIGDDAHFHDSHHPHLCAAKIRVPRALLEVVLPLLPSVPSSLVVSFGSFEQFPCSVRDAVSFSPHL